MQQVVTIHGGNAYDTYEAFIADLWDQVISLNWLTFRDWKNRLSEELGSEYEVIMPRMPNPQNAKYLEWKIWFEKLIPLLRDDVILIGHSLGGIFLTKYLSENQFPRRIQATFLVAAPYNTPTEHPVADFILQEPLQRFIEQAGEIFLYHSEDDNVVPFSNFERYKMELPYIHERIFKDRQHFNQPEFAELVEDIRRLNVI